jgi:hypothetical protein
MHSDQPPAYTLLNLFPRYGWPASHVTRAIPSYGVGGFWFPGLRQGRTLNRFLASLQNFASVSLIDVTRLGDTVRLQTQQDKHTIMRSMALDLREEVDSRYYAGGSRRPVGGVDIWPRQPVAMSFATSKC